jgi:hypothetical protein
MGGEFMKFLTVKLLSVWGLLAFILTAAAFFFAGHNLPGYRIVRVAVTNTIQPTNIIRPEEVVRILRTITNTDLSNEVVTIISNDVSPFVGIQDRDKFNIGKGDQSAVFTLKPWQTVPDWWISVIGNPYNSVYGLSVERRITGGIYGGLELTESGFTNYQGYLILSLTL